MRPRTLEWFRVGGGLALALAGGCADEDVAVPERPGWAGSIGDDTVEGGETFVPSDVDVLSVYDTDGSDPLPRSGNDDPVEEPAGADASPIVESPSVESACVVGAQERVFQTLEAPRDGQPAASAALTRGRHYRIEVQHEERWPIGWLRIDERLADWRPFGVDVVTSAIVVEGEGRPLVLRHDDCGAGCSSGAAAPLPVRIVELYADPRTWPNAMSCANSDAWLVDHHHLVETLRPRVLVLHTDAKRSPSETLELFEEAREAIAEGSRDHGYERDSAAAPALRYELARIVDAREVPAEQTRGLPPRQGSFDYAALFGELWTRAYGVADPREPHRLLSLCELVDAGFVHEVWVVADLDHRGAEGGEVFEVKPYYDDRGKRRAEQGLGGCAGTVCLEDTETRPWPAACSRSVRIVLVDGKRPESCLRESLSHGLEAMAASQHIPTLTRYFAEFAGFELDTRHALPFSSWYEACPAHRDAPCLAYLGADRVAWMPPGAPPVEIANYDPVCGSVHFPPNARRPGDVSHAAPVLTSCESYRRRDGADGEDQKRPWDASRLDPELHDGSGCMGAWDLWWRQNIPGTKNLALGDDGRPMPSWWPFLFY